MHREEELTERRATVPPRRASRNRVGGKPWVSGDTVATSAAETAASVDSIRPGPSVRAAVRASATISASCHVPIPIARTSRSPTPMPTATPSIISSDCRTR